MERLDKVLANYGIGSRKEVSKLIRKKGVKINGVLIKNPSLKVNPNEVVVELENGQVLRPANHFYYKFYKPKGYITSTKDRLPTIMELLPEDLPGKKRLFPAGRLDRDAEGLVILTTDGEFAHRITHPKWKLPKLYEVEIEKGLSESWLKILEEGIELKEGKTLPCKIKPLNQERTKLLVEVYEGRYHLLKRMFAKAGTKVLNIKRLAIGKINLEDMKEGEVKALSPEELRLLRKEVSL